MSSTILVLTATVSLITFGECSFARPWGHTSRTGISNRNLTSKLEELCFYVLKLCLGTELKSYENSKTKAFE